MVNKTSRNREGFVKELEKLELKIFLHIFLNTIGFSTTNISLFKMLIYNQYTLTLYLFSWFIVSSFSSSFVSAHLLP